MEDGALCVPAQENNENQPFAQENAQEIISNDFIKELDGKSIDDKILALLTQNPELTRKETAKLLKVTPDIVKHHIEKLKREGLPFRTGFTKNGAWVVKWSIRNLGPLPEEWRKIIFILR